MHFGCVELVNSTARLARHARLDSLDSFDKVELVESCRDEPSGIWALDKHMQNDEKIRVGLIQ